MKRNVVLTACCSLLFATSLFGAKPLADDELSQKRQHREKLLQRARGRFDANHNGVLERDEKAAFKKWRKEHRAEMLAKFDTNKNGRLDSGEREAARAGIRAQKRARKLKSA